LRDHRGAAGDAAGWPGEVRPARAGDAEDVARLAAELAMSFEFSPASFRQHYLALLAEDDARLLLAVSGHQSVGYLLGFRHLTFYANGPVGWVEEIVVRHQDQGRGIGRILMSAFEQWATARGCTLVALATRRAGPFYRALGYQESAAYFRKILIERPTGGTAGDLPPSPPAT
jgi:GNAT superfamily N-acetyltransferase